MSSAVAELKNANHAVVQFDQAKLDLLKRTLCADLTDDEFEMFAGQCRRTGLDPFNRQIHAIKRKGKVNIQTGIDGFRLIAERTGNYAPGKEPTFTFNADGDVTSATAYVEKFIRGEWKTISATAFWDEFYPGDGGDGFMWRKMPCHMLAKCAEALALRKAFPLDLSGLYTDEEMHQAEGGHPHKPRGSSPAGSGKAPDPDRVQQLQQELAGLVGKVSEGQQVPAEELVAKLIEHGKAKCKMNPEWASLRDFNEKWLVWAVDIFKRKVENLTASKPANGQPAAPSEEPPAREPGIDPEDEGDDAELPPRHDEGAPVGKAGGKLPATVVDTLTRDIHDAGFDWERIRVRSGEILGVVLGPSAALVDLSLDQAGKVRTWCAQQKAGRRKTQAA